MIHRFPLLVALLMEILRLPVTDSVVDCRTTNREDNYVSTRGKKPYSALKRCDMLHTRAEFSVHIIALMRFRPYPYRCRLVQRDLLKRPSPPHASLTAAGLRDLQGHSSPTHY
jgi:hypothetical protein